MKIAFSSTRKKINQFKRNKLKNKKNLNLITLTIMKTKRLLMNLFQK